jgi:hypothetical protein
LQHQAQQQQQQLLEQERVQQQKQAAESSQTALRELSAKEHALFSSAARALRLILRRAAPYLRGGPASDAAICEALAELPFWYPDQRPTSCAACQVQQGLAFVEQVGGVGVGGGVWVTHVG